MIYAESFVMLDPLFIIVSY